MAQSPGPYSRFAGLRWIRRFLPSGDEVSFRPYALRRRLLPTSLSPVKIVKADDSTTLHSLCALFYRGLARPEALWWLVAEANCIVDPTLKLSGRDVKVPPLRLLEIPLEQLPTEYDE